MDAYIDPDYASWEEIYGEGSSKLAMLRAKEEGR